MPRTPNAERPLPVPPAEVLAAAKVTLPPSAVKRMAVAMQACKSA